MFKRNTFWYIVCTYVCMYVCSSKEKSLNEIENSRQKEDGYHK